MRRNINPIFRRNALLSAAVVLMLIAVATDPKILPSVLTIRGLVGTVLVAVAGLFAAIGIHDIAETFLRGPGEPWYARPGAMLFLPVVLMATNALLIVFGGIGPLSVPKARLYQFTAAELLWIVLLEWPHRVTGQASKSL